MDSEIYYTKKEIYGIRIYSFIDEYKILFENKYDTIINNEIIKNVKNYYENLDENNRKNLKFQIYTKCKSIDNRENFMMWWNISLNDFIKYFNIL